MAQLSDQQKGDLIALTLSAPYFRRDDLNRPIPIDADLARRIVEADDALASSANTIDALVDAIPPPASEPVSKGSAWFTRVHDELGEAVSRVGDAPGFVLTRALEDLRVPLNDNVTRFIGDVFVYLSRRTGDIGITGLPEIGKIPRDFLSVLVQAQNDSPGEKTVVLSHSMGGQIVYDAVTRFLPAYPEFAQIQPIDVWCACASQVGLFEEMKLFLKSDQTVSYPQRVAHPRSFGRVGKWLNVWDRNDILSYTARPIFADMDVDDREYLSGATVMNAHGAYLVRPSFYRMLADAI